MKKKIIRPSARENIAITKAAMSDPDSHPLTDKEWNEIKHKAVWGLGRPAGSDTKEQITKN
jgi:hypothetical protein